MLPLLGWLHSNLLPLSPQDLAERARHDSLDRPMADILPGSDNSDTIEKYMEVRRPCLGNRDAV